MLAQENHFEILATFALIAIKIRLSLNYSTVDSNEGRRITCIGYTGTAINQGALKINRQTNFPHMTDILIGKDQ